jgi:hypothetical protein
MFETGEVYDEISQCFLSSEIVGRSLQHEPHSHFWKIHTLLILVWIVSGISVGFVSDGRHGEILDMKKRISNLVSNNITPLPPLKFWWIFKGEINSTLSQEKKRAIIICIENKNTVL